MTDDYQQIKSVINDSHNVVILQADNPDADSLGSALALEQIIGDLGKEPRLYCAVDMPTYLRYLSGWDRVSNILPGSFDTAIIVDASSLTLFEKLYSTGQQRQLLTSKVIILDHHGSFDNAIDFATVNINKPEKSSTGELIYDISKELGWQMSVKAQEFLMTAILGDTQGLSNSLTSASTYRVLADMIDAGVNRPALEELRRLSSKMPEVIFRYKADLIKRTEFYIDNKLAVVVIPQNEIYEYSPLYNPAPLIINDLLQTEGVGVAVVLKSYDDGHITAAIKGNSGSDICDQLAANFGGGGHKLASGFKVSSGKSIDEIKNECISKARELLLS